MAMSNDNVGSITNLYFLCQFSVVDSPEFVLLFCRSAYYHHFGIIMVVLLVVSNITDLSASHLADIRESDLFGLDCEGVYLGRFGEVCTIQLSTRSTCFIFDMVVPSTLHHPVVPLLKEILEDPSKTKIIHDCRMDADALLHLYNIELKGIYDTQVWHTECRGGDRTNLNDTLRQYGLEANAVRDSSVYKTNPRFWATRPLTPQMLEWASGDVSLLFELYGAQVMGANDELTTRCKLSSEDCASSARTAVTEKVEVSSDMMGLVIGRGGCNIKSLELKFPRSLFQRHPGGVIVYAKDDRTLADAVRALKVPIEMKRLHQLSRRSGGARKK